MILTIVIIAMFILIGVIWMIAYAVAVHQRNQIDAENERLNADSEGNIWVESNLHEESYDPKLPENFF